MSALVSLCCLVLWWQYSVSPDHTRGSHLCSLIQQGMTRTEVDGILGQPTETNSAMNRQYADYFHYQISVVFEDGKVVSAEYTPPPKVSWWRRFRMALGLEIESPHHPLRSFIPCRPAVRNAPARQTISPQ